MTARAGRPARWGVLAAVAYVIVAVVSSATGLIGGRPLYDGVPLQPYRWVSPPPARVDNNVAPQGADTTLRHTGEPQPDPNYVTTGDVQATIIFEQIDASKAQPGGPDQMPFRITPLDPVTLGPKPAGRFFDSNAYRIEGTYPDGTPITDGRFSIVLTYAVHGTDIRRWDGTAWVPVERPRAERTTLQIYAFTPVLGTFVVTGDGDVPREPEAATEEGGNPRLFLVVFVGAFIGIGAALLTGTRQKKTPPARGGAAPGGRRTGGGAAPGNGSRGRRKGGAAPPGDGSGSGGG